MATGGGCDNDSPSHGLTETKMRIYATDYGPLNEFKSDTHYNNFAAAGYYVTTPKANVLPLYRLYGEKAGPVGQYWTLEKRGGNESYRHDFAVERSWNALSGNNTILVPKGVLLYEGKVSASRTYLGGGWQVFIPGDVLKPIMDLQPILKSEVQWNQHFVDQRLKQINETQQNILQKWQEESIKRITSNTKVEDMISNAHRSGSFPSDIYRAMQNMKNGELGAENQIRTGTFNVGKTKISLPGGMSFNMSLSTKIEFIRTKTETYTVGRTVVTKITHYYRITYIWTRA